MFSSTLRSVPDLKGPTAIPVPISYTAWPGILRDANGDLIVICSQGVQHAYDATRKVVAWKTTGLRFDQWVSETVYDSGNDDYTNSYGLDAQGRPLVWILERTSSNFDTGTGQQVLRRRESGSWSTVTTIAAAAYTPKIRLIDPVVVLPNGDLMCHWFGVSDGDSEHGVLISDDDGATWSRTTIASSLDDTERPVEVRFVVLANGDIFGIGRTEEDGGALFQLTCDNGDDPADAGSWTKSVTNITDQDRTPSGLVRDASDNLHLYYYDRDVGVLRYRTVAAATVYGSPTSWPASTALVSGEGTDADGGYPHAFREGTVNRVVFYSGQPVGVAVIDQVRIHLLNHQTA